MPDYQNLLSQKKSLLATKRPPRAREAAKQLNISEAEFVALSCNDSCQLLKHSAFEDILQGLETVGEVMALTRNEAMVLESHGVYKGVVSRHGHIIVNTKDIDLRLRVTDWQYGFSVNENERQSLQFFDQFGVATHKIYLIKKSNTEAYKALIKDHVTTDGFDQLNIKKKLEVQINDVEINSSSLQKDWLALNDVHKIGALFDKYQATRPQAYRHLGPNASMLSNNALKEVLETASNKDIPLLIFVSNYASTHIHNGTVHKLMQMDSWFNVLDPRLNLHANMDLIAETWLVIKPGDDKEIYSMELFDEKQQTLMMIYLHMDAKDDSQMQTLWSSTLQNLKLDK